MFEKNIFKKVNNFTTKNIEQYKKKQKLFSSDSLLGRIYPSLLSKAMTYKFGYYWSYKFKLLSLKNYHINPLNIFRLLISYFKILFLFYSYFDKRKKIICLLTRAQGMRTKNSLEDYRFRGLEKKLTNDHKIIYFIHGTTKSQSKSKYPAIFSSDIYHLSRLIFLLIYPYLKVKFLLRNETIFKWQYDLIINLIASIIVSIFSKFIDISFFWDFNYYHYPLFLGSYLSNSKLIGGMHNFNYIGQLPWISDSTINHLNIKYDFIDYESIYKIINKKTITKYKNIGNFKIQASKLNIVIIQENQTNPESLLKFVKSVKNNINKIYIKLRPDRDDAENFLEFLKRFDLRFEQINDLFSDKTKNFIFLGTSSTLLLDLALSNRIAISYSINKIRYFEYPSRNFVNLISKTQRNKSKNKIIENPIYISNKKDFYELINSESLILPSNSAKNHLMFKNHKIQSFLKFCQS